jgi:hypothetical protein
MVLIAYLVVGFVQQVRVSQQRQEELRKVEQGIAIALEEQASLERQLEHARSDLAVDEWAREYGWSRPDEVPVVVIAPGEGSFSDSHEEQEKEATSPDSTRDAWWALFFGTR